MPINISLYDAGKRYNREWIFRHLTTTFKGGAAYAITGPNGSGKSTLLQTIAGAVGLSEGKVNYSENDQPVPEAEVYRKISFAAPYLELVEEMTLFEFLAFHQSFKPFYPEVNLEKAAEMVGLARARDKQIVHFSSGMKQRLKLAQAFFSDTAVLLLDEPTANLDAEGIAVYHHLVKEFRKDRIVIVSSNDEQEYLFCHSVIRIGDYKK
jgi:ABC-type multidrug transport system ATPase subunit